MSSAAWIFAGLLIIGPIYCASGFEDPPRFLTLPKTQAVGLYHSAVFVCSAAGDPSPTFEWLKDGDSVKGSRVRDIPGGTLLRINATRHEDEGSYACVADNGVGHPLRAVADLTIVNKDGPFPEDFPRIIEGPTREVADAGKDVLLTCRAEGDLEPTVTWLRDSIPVDMSDSRYSLVDGSSLQITNLQNQDSGHYECMAENSVGSIMSDSALLLVRDESNDVAKSRRRRSLWNLKDMVKSVTGREGEDFINYGNWCGLGGSGDPVDAIDECCRNHDFCYDLATRGACKKNGKKGVYNLTYKWRVADDGTAVCKDEEDQCKIEICFCDAIIANCLKSNIDAFDPENQHELDMLQMLEAANWISA